MPAYGANQKRKKKNKGYTPPGGSRSLATNPPPPQPVASTKTIMENGIPMIISTEPSPSPVKIRKDLPPPDATLTPDKVKNYRTNGTKPKLVLAPVHFDSGKADVDVGASLQFQEALEYGLLGYHILIEGHTDDVGTAESNLRLSMKRINEIRTMLIHVGIDDNHVSIMPYGESMPLVPNTSEVNRHKNRRVQFLIF
ncbi:OmpA family protein [Flexibacter flexilis]|nr:OmpA family protein [Flexibacter flexilis]